MPGPTRIILGCDHAGLELKQALAAALRGWGYPVDDLGCHDAEPVDYPDYALAVSRRVVGSQDLGVLVCGTGIGMAIAANKVNGARAAICHEPYSATTARAHNNANVLCMGGRVIGPELAKAVLRAFIESDFEGGRHLRRLEKITHVENKPGR